MSNLSCFVSTRFGAILLAPLLLCTAAGCGAESTKETAPDPSDASDSSELAAQGCDLSREASLYEGSATGSRGVAQTGTALNIIPCLTLTGLGSAETTLGIHSDGTVIVAPVFTKDGTGLLT